MTVNEKKELCKIIYTHMGDRCEVMYVKENISGADNKYVFH